MAERIFRQAHFSLFHFHAGGGDGVSDVGDRAEQTAVHASLLGDNNNGAFQLFATGLGSNQDFGCCFSSSARRASIPSGWLRWRAWPCLAGSGSYRA